MHAMTPVSSCHPANTTCLRKQKRVVINAYIEDQCGLLLRFRTKKTGIVADIKSHFQKLCYIK